MTAVLDELTRIISGRVCENEPMACHTTLGVGGPADYYVECETERELSELVKYIHSARIEWMILGDGANILVSDRGIRGVVIRLTGDFTSISVAGTRITAGSAARISKVADIAAESSLSGLEGVGTVPGTVGGAVVMNAGTHRGYIDEVVETVSVVTNSGEKRVLAKGDCGFSYRASRFQTDASLIITSVEFELSPGDGQAIARDLESVRQHRLDTQPCGRSAGCFFKNPSGQSAGNLIDKAGCKGWREGGAQVSETHANFIINENNATASDLFGLAERVRKAVSEKHGITLQYEVKVVGDWEMAEK